MAYEVVARIGRGGMGVVDLAKDEHGRQVALKRLALHGSDDEMTNSRLRIRREAEILAQLDHPGIVELLDVLDDGDDIVLVMPYLAGGTLSDYIEKNGPLPALRVMALAGLLLNALSAAHRQGIVHRDIKPANIIFDENGWPRLTDFGTAVARDATPGLTVAGTVIGTPEYMAPEQARGLEATPASDIFSLGATLRFAATGTPPFGRGDPAIVVQRAAKGHVDPWPKSTDRSIRRLVDPMMSKDPAKRPNAASLVGGPTGTDVLEPRNRRFRPALLGVAAATIAVVGIAALLVVNLRAHPGEEALATPESPMAVVTAPTTEPCKDLPYQPCGKPAAPYTDGVSCLADHADYDGNASNGCEAVPDDKDRTTLVGSIKANLVPGTDIDNYPFHVADEFQLLCDGTLRVTLTAPVGTSMRLDVLQNEVSIGTTVSTDGIPSTVTLVEQNCMGDDSTDLIARVSWAGDTRSSLPYTLERAGSF